MGSNNWKFQCNFKLVSGQTTESADLIFIYDPVADSLLS